MDALSLKFFDASLYVESSPSSLLASSAVTIFHAQRHFFVSFTFYIHTVSLLPMVGKLSHALFICSSSLCRWLWEHRHRGSCDEQNVMMRTILSVEESKQSAVGGSWRNAAVLRLTRDKPTSHHGALITPSDGLTVHSALVFPLSTSTSTPPCLLHVHKAFI